MLCFLIDAHLTRSAIIVARQNVLIDHKVERRSYLGARESTFGLIQASVVVAHRASSAKAFAVIQDLIFETINYSFHYLCKNSDRVPSNNKSKQQSEEQSAAW